MRSLLHLLGAICLLRRGPQDLPHSPRLLLGVCALSLMLQWAIAQALGVTGDTLGAGIVALAFNLGILFFLLSLRRRTHRFVQAGLALISCALLFSLLSLPIALLAGGHPPTPDNITPLQIVLGLIALPLVVWKIVVDAHILRHSMDLPFLAGLALAIFWLILELRLGAAFGTAPVSA